MEEWKCFLKAEGVASSGSAAIEQVLKSAKGELLAEDDIIEVYRELEEKREELAKMDDELAAGGAFKLVADGGQWTKENKGVANNAIMGLFFW